MIQINSIVEVSKLGRGRDGFLGQKPQRWILQDVHILTGGSMILVGRRINKKGQIIKRLNQTAFNYMTDGKMMWDSKEVGYWANDKALMKLNNNKEGE